MQQLPRRGAENFNFARDVVDALALEDKEKPASSGAMMRDETMRFFDIQWRVPGQLRLFRKWNEKGRHGLFLMKDAGSFGSMHGLYALGSYLFPRPFNSLRRISSYRVEAHR